MTERVKLVIDSDGLTDDVRAISLALHKADVKALTAVHGCIPVDQVVANLTRTLRANAQSSSSSVPVFRGASGPLIPARHDHSEAFFFGKDGIGDCPDDFPKVIPEDFINFDVECPAAMALIKLFKQDNDLVLVCLGPLTNVALALKLDPSFASAPRQLVIMGGNSHGCGNVRFDSTAEFNFHRDPEAAHCVLAEMMCPITCVPWEAYLFEGRQHEANVNFHSHLEFDTPLALFLRSVTGKCRESLARNDRQLAYCDEIAVAVALQPDNMIKQFKSLRVSVELHGQYTRGQVAVDWLDELWSNEAPETLTRLDRSRKPVKFVTAYDVHLLDRMIHEAVLDSK